ncbi:U8 snoRNA-decapping enzyme [Pimephales promelas]|nr:U8 snoRNA-decapping enzyme [Pimephales promelas]
MQMRFDGLLGFPGGLVNPNKETLEAGLSRELHEELITHFYIKKMTEPELKEIERAAVTTATDHGLEVMGMVRVPLYFLKNGGGLPYFLSHSFICNSRAQLLSALHHCRLLSQGELEKAFISIPEPELCVHQTTAGEISFVIATQASFASLHGGQAGVVRVDAGRGEIVETIVSEASPTMLNCILLPAGPSTLTVESPFQAFMGGVMVPVDHWFATRELKHRSGTEKRILCKPAITVPAAVSLRGGGRRGRGFGYDILSDCLRAEETEREAVFQHACVERGSCLHNVFEGGKSSWLHEISVTQTQCSARDGPLENQARTIAFNHCLRKQN